MSALDKITQDLDWRETELGALKILLVRDDITSNQKSSLLRAAWTMLYAHYEGFVKNALSVFFAEVERSIVGCHVLPTPTRILAHSKSMKVIRSLPAAEMIVALDSFHTIQALEIPSFPEVETDSNLWPNKLIELLEGADIRSEFVEARRIELRTLVQRRNDIAHGKRNLIGEISYYNQFEDAVYGLMYDLAFAIEARLNASPYQHLSTSVADAEGN
ncbi:MAE_28990/MAE_18760 family HEPN-like nuclease [Rhizobium sp. NFR12]|uniref:MAE_28990/MAE_18760 family HEPN-like nuclease n=1 Tax=Rhizobium sp. NFR12 TaxID=1566261 RepID=UPI0008A786DA|nr:MAE_28990/MAE_18760 family HEPN-like nuclease [Rhizobium sp. NFR12]SEH22577.1 hypothetical protein SAMN03159407_1212 [Rhizobium sp. NFR12]